VEFLRLCYQVSIRRAVQTLSAPRATRYYRSRKAEQAPLRHRIKEIAAIRVRYGYRRIHTLLQREGWLVNHKRVYRLYCLEGLQMRHKPPRRRVSAKCGRIGRTPSGPISAGPWTLWPINSSMAGACGS
jgi:putative transposase